MELNPDNRALCAPHTILDTVAEQLADVDMTLPDYCPNIEKILKCSLTPKIQSRSLSGGQLQVEGICTVNVLYVDEEKKTIRCCEQNVNFSQHFTVRDTPENYVVLTKTKPEYINCRALSPRRLVIHGAFSLYARVIAPNKTLLYTPEPGTLEARREEISCAVLDSLCQEQFTLSEEISIGDKPPIEAMLTDSVNACITDVKAVSGKLMLSGEISLKLFYLTNVETGETAKTDYILPFNQIIDCVGAQEDSLGVTDCEVLSYDIRLKNDVLSEKPLVVVDAKICVTREGFTTRTEELITDAYSTEYAVTLERENIGILAEVIPVNEHFIEKTTALIENCRLSGLLDIYTDSVTLNITPNEEGLKAEGKLNLCIIALNEDGFPVFIERSCEYSRLINSASDCNDMLFPCVHAGGVSYRLADDSSVELRCELTVTGGAVRSETRRVVSNVVIDEDKPLPDDGCALTLYYAAPNEDLWDIAKSHRTRLDLLTAENETEDAAADMPRMLLIPKI